MNVRGDFLSSFLLLVLSGLLTSTLGDITTTVRRYERNNQAVLPCREYGPTSQDLAVQWFRGTNLLSSNDRVVNSGLRSRIFIERPAPGEWNLVIRRVDESFAGTYLCKTNKGQPLSSIKLVIETPPKIDEAASTNEHTVFTEHSYAKLECKVSGEPPPVVTWYRGESMTELGINGEVLILPNIVRYASDEYTCIARNKHGEAERRMTVDVKFGPEVAVMNTTIHADIGEVIVMACRIQAYPSPKVYWTNHEHKNVKSNWKYKIIEEEESDHIPVRIIVLVIGPAKVSVHDEGTYTCTAISDIGEAHSAVVTLSVSRP